MRLSCSFPPGPHVVAHAQLAEQLGYARIWLYDSPLLYPDVWMTLSRIAEAAVIGIPDARTGERCCAVVVPRDGAGLDLAELARYCREAGLARQKIPEQLEIVAELPRNASGKVRKHELRGRYAAGSA